MKIHLDPLVACLSAALAVSAMACSDSSPAAAVGVGVKDSSPEITPMDGTVEPTGQDGGSAGDATLSDDSGEAGAPCLASQHVALDTVNAAGLVSAAGVDYYTFTVTATSGVLARIRPQGANVAPPSSIALTTECGETTDGAAFPPATRIAAGTYTRAMVSPGNYALRVTWDGSVAPNTAYTFDLERYATPTNGACASAAALTTSGSVIGDTLEATDTATGCVANAGGLGQLFYSVQLPANTGWQVTAVPGNASSLVLQALTTCASTTCFAPTATSSSAGAPASLSLVNSASSPASFIIGASVQADEAASAGGSFALIAETLAACAADDDAGSCGGNEVCCGGFCEPPGPANHCGQGGSTCTACPDDPGHHGSSACNGTTCALDCFSGYCLNAAGTQCVAWDASHCGTGTCGDCTVGTPAGATVSCSLTGQCSTECPSGSCLSSNACVAWSAQNCGSSCGTCGATPPNATWGCPSGTCTPQCTSGWTDCDGDASNGCETNTATNSGHCGTCGKACAQTETCVAGACKARCPQGQCYTGTQCVAVDRTANCGATCSPCAGWATLCAVGAATPMGMCCDAISNDCENYPGVGCMQCQ